MSSKAIVTLALGFGVLVGAAPARGQSGTDNTAPPPALSAGSSVGVVSAYVWRGFTPIDAVSTQPTAWVALGNLTLSSWANLSGSGNPHGVDEHDLTLDYTRAMGSVRVSVGYINYFFPGASGARVSNEFYAGVSRPGLLNPFVKVFTDVHQGSGTYVSGGLGHSLTVAAISLTPTVALGYNHEQWVDGSGFSDLNVGVQAAWTSPGGRLAVAPFVNYSKSFQSEWFPSKVYGGLTITVKQ